MWKRYTKESVIADGAQCLVARCFCGKYDTQLATFRKHGTPWNQNNFICCNYSGEAWYPDVQYYYELPAHLCIDGMSADEHPDLIIPQNDALEVEKLRADKALLLDRIAVLEVAVNKPCRDCDIAKNAVIS